MRDSLANAVNELGLEPGQIFQGTVAGCEVQIRRPPEPATPATALQRQDESPIEEPSQFADMVMLDPWIDLGQVPPERVITVKAKVGPGPWPDPPVVPPDDEVEE